MRPVSLTERLIQRIHLKEEVAASPTSQHQLDHRFYRDFVVLNGLGMRKLVISLMLSCLDELQDALARGPSLEPGESGDLRFKTTSLATLTVKVQWLLFEYGMGLLVFDPEGKRVYCKRTGYRSRGHMHEVVHRKVNEQEELIFDILEGLSSSLGRCDFFERLKKYSSQKTLTRPRNRKRVHKQQLELGLHAIWPRGYRPKSSRKTQHD